MSIPRGGSPIWMQQCYVTLGEWGVLTAMETVVSTNAYLEKWVFTKFNPILSSTRFVLARNVAISVGDLLREQTIQRIARRSAPIAHTSPAAVEKVEERAWQLSPIQQMFSDSYLQSQNHFNQSLLLKLARTVLDSHFRKYCSLPWPVIRCSAHASDKTKMESGRQFVAKIERQAFAFSEPIYEMTSS